MQARKRAIEPLLHAAIIAVPFALAVCLAIWRLAPSGTFVVSTPTTAASPYINRLLPAERAPAEGEYVTVVDEPVYFSVDIPDGYTAADVTVEYRPHSQPVVELGTLTDIYSQSYDLRPLWNGVLDGLAWTRSEENGLSLFARNGMTIGDFLADPPPRQNIATYHADLDAPYRDSTYRPLASPQTIAASLRGYHKFATYTGGEPIDFTFAYMDMNRTAGPDAGVVWLWNERGEAVREIAFADDGNTTDNQVSTGLVTLRLTADGLPEGVYTVELSGTSDIFWRTITSTQRYVTFVNRLYVGDDVGYRDGDRVTTFVTDAKHLVFETFHADSADRVTLGTSELLLTESHRKIRHSVAEPGVVTGSVPAGDVKMTGDGLFALSAASFFNPYPARMNAYTDLDALGIDYVLTTYTSGETLEDGWRRGSARFDLSAVYRQEGAATFLLSAPSIAERDGSVDVRRITVAFHKPKPTLRDMVRQLRDWFAPGL